MKKNIRLFATFLILLGIIMIISAFLLKGTNNSSSENSERYNLKNNTYKDISLINKKDINNCKNIDNCNLIRGSIPTIKLNSPNEVLENIIKEENALNNQYYQEFINSTMQDDACKDLLDKYKHSIYPEIIVDVYSNKNISTLSIKRSKLNVCTNEYQTELTKSYIYDYKQKALLTKEQILQQNNLTYDDIVKTIKKSINNIAEVNNVNLSIDNCITENGEIAYELFYSTDGKLWVDFLFKDLNNGINSLQDIVL